MTLEEIKAKSAEIAALYTAKANGKTLQYRQSDHRWNDVPSDVAPTICGDLSCWRVKPEPRRMWRQLDVNGEFTVAETFCEGIAISWKSAGHTVTEWQEVLP